MLIISHPSLPIAPLTSPGCKAHQTTKPRAHGETARRARRTWRAAATRSSHISQPSITTCPATQCPLREGHPPRPKTLLGREKERGGHHPASLRVKDGEVAPTAPDKARHDDRSCPLPGWHFLPIDPGTFAQSTGGQKGAGRRGEREAARPSLSPSPPAPHRPGDDASPHGRSPMAPARVLLLRRDASTCPHPQGLHAANAAAASRRRDRRPCWRPPPGTPAHIARGRCGRRRRRAIEVPPFNGHAPDGSRLPRERKKALFFEVAPNPKLAPTSAQSDSHATQWFIKYSTYIRLGFRHSKRVAPARNSNERAPSDSSLHHESMMLHALAIQCTRACLQASMGICRGSHVGPPPPPPPSSLAVVNDRSACGADGACEATLPDADGRHAPHVEGVGENRRTEGSGRWRWPATAAASADTPPVPAPPTPPSSRPLRPPWHRGLR